MTDNLILAIYIMGIKALSECFYLHHVLAQMLDFVQPCFLAHKDAQTCDHHQHTYDCDPFFKILYSILPSMSAWGIIVFGDL